MKPLFAPLAAIAILAIAAAACSAPAKPTTLEAAVISPKRSAANVARDEYRHPAQTLAFFGIRPDSRVVEVYPGGGWYSEILAPYLAAEGSLTVVAPEKALAGLRKKADADAATYQGLVFSPLDRWNDKTSFPQGSTDAVLTFRNVHNWQMQGKAADAFRAFYRMLKPGGTLGVVEHRLPEGRPDSDMEKSGYMKQSAVIAMAKAAGFKLAKTSEINANSKDNADHPEGVWTLPPSYALGDKDRAKYAAIGESDRMTLKFVKPGK